LPSLRAFDRLPSYFVAIGLVAVATTLRLAGDPWLGVSVPYLFFYPAIMIAAILGGVGPGVVATGLSAFTSVYLYLAPVRSMMVRETGEIVALVLFVLNGILMSRIGGIARRATVREHELAAIVQSSDDAIVGKELDGTIRTWNPGAERLFQYTAAEVVGQPITILIPPDRLSEETHVLTQIRAGHRVEPYETIRRRKDGTEIDVSLTVSPIRDAGGTVIGASKIARDISERRRAERLRDELVERERSARDEAVVARDRLAFLADVGAVLTSSLDYGETLNRAVHLAIPRLGDYCNVVITDDQGRMRHVAWGHVVRAKEAILRELALRLIERPTAGGMTLAATVMTTGRTLVMPHDALVKAATDARPYDPEAVALAVQLQPWAYIGVPLYVRGRAVGVMSFGTSEQESRRDYTDVDIVMVEEFARRVSLAVENARLFRQAEELNRLKDEFLATVSHELRTPLGAVMGWARMLANGQLSPDRAKQAIDAIERNAQAQARLVDDILDVARGIAGNVKLEMQPVDLSAVAHAGVEAIAPTAAGRKIALEVGADQPVIVMGDPARLRQVVWNLLSNAVKFTPIGGRVTVGVRADDGDAVLEVSDTGMGIAEAFLPYVFDKFRQADASFTRQHGGLGLGLAIARHLIELHGGSIEARSAGEGAGATFVVRLPLSTRAAEDSARAPAASAAARGVAHEIPDHDH
jgi:PAS domain S-box-containing protein